MYAVVVEFLIHPPQLRAFEAAIVANARQSLADEPGCRRFDVCRDLAEPRRFLLYELYDDAAAFEAHLATPHFRAFDAACAPWVERKAVQRLARLLP